VIYIFLAVYACIVDVTEVREWQIAVEVIAVIVVPFDILCFVAQSVGPQLYDLLWPYMQGINSLLNTVDWLSV